MTRDDANDLSIYIHVPFCLQKCRYCDFLSVPLPNLELLDAYTAALECEIQLQAKNLSDRIIRTVYLGGGTPSLLASSQLNRIMESVRVHFQLGQDVEISLEANPATINREKLSAYRDAGINRISLGVQSFNDSELKRLGRHHRAKDALQTVEELHQLGWANFNLDLIYGLPGQSIDGFRNNLEMAAGLQPAHLSAYLLQLAPDTPLGAELARGLWQEAPEEQLAAMYHETRDYLLGQGYHQYELSNFCRPGLKCQHNLVYWQGRPYLGLGSGAVSYLENQRTMNPWPLDDYFASLEHDNLPSRKVLETLNERDKLAEAMVMGLRLCEGISLEDVARRLGVDPWTYYGPIIEEFMERAWLLESCGKLRLNPEYYFVSNQILCHFID